MNPKVNNNASRKTKKYDEEDDGEEEEKETARLLSEDPMEWMLKNEQVSNLLSDVRDHELPNRIISMVEEMEYKTPDTDCILLLLCKLKPFIWSMQKAVNNRIVGEKIEVEIEKNVDENRLDVFFKFIPSYEDFVNNGVDCEDIYKTCKIF
ncbi:CLUMA_CG010384, isoform A [Clunio marinus]|uniref:CLUMA_CG010384, isoform A n=1 Tax=Clunio marinus TaxID=568069 RepID=A0A1J1I9L0_9DIPT|nr:CLUMA_CG010384, isoform A [Clunio marinus]